MPKLWEPHWLVDPSFRVWRGRITLFVVGWNPGSWLSYGASTVIKETVFGGFTFHVDLDPRMYSWNHKEWDLDKAIKNIYVNWPDGSGPISCGPVYVRVGAVPPENRMGLVLDMPGLPTVYYFQNMGNGPPGYWARDNRPLVGNMPYIYHP